MIVFISFFKFIVKYSYGTSCREWNEVLFIHLLKNYLHVVYSSMFVWVSQLSESTRDKSTENEISIGQRQKSKVILSFFSPLDVLFLKIKKPKWMVDKGQANCPFSESYFCIYLTYTNVRNFWCLMTAFSFFFSFWQKQFWGFKLWQERKKVFNINQQRTS